MVSVAVFCTSSASPEEAAPAKSHGMEERHPSFFCGASFRSSAQHQTLSWEQGTVFVFFLPELL